jgi:epsilon-lactone hydrolase
VTEDQAEQLLAELRDQAKERGDRPERARELYEEAMSAFPPLPEVEISRAPVPGVESWWVRAPGVSEEATVLYLHGGGFVVGSVASHADLLGRLSRSSGAQLLGVDYRLLPEHPFPAALDDALAAYRWLVAEGLAPVLVAGNSSGACLALSAALAIRDSEEPPPVALALLSPWVDMTVSAESLGRNRGTDWFDVPGLRIAADAYLDGREPTHPLASPVHGDLSGLPPMFVQAAETEQLLDDARSLAARAREAGVAVTLDLWPAMFHNWQLFASRIQDGRLALERAAQFAVAHLGTAP